MIALGLFLITSVAFATAMLQLNKQASIMKVMNSAKAVALSEIQKVSNAPYDPAGVPPVVSSILALGTTTSQSDVGDSSIDLGSIPATITWTVSSVPGGLNLRSVLCRVDYKYLGKNLSYELFTYKSPD